MGARWAWFAACEDGHGYSNFSGGADDCYTCNKPPAIIIDCPHWAFDNTCDCGEELKAEIVKMNKEIEGKKK